MIPQKDPVKPSAPLLDQKENIARGRRTTTTLCTAARILSDGGGRRRRRRRRTTGILRV
jgi:hypothetical protein